MDADDGGPAHAAPRQTITLNGSGQYRAADLAGQTGSILVGGSGQATVWVRDRLDTRIAGSGMVGYYGQPTVTTDMAGSGSITRLGEK